MLWTATGWTALAVVALLVAEKRRSTLGRWIAKPAASLGFVALGLLGTNPAPVIQGWIVAALIACALGDVLLIPEGRGPTFLAGVGAFALGHGLYAVAFWRLEPQLWAAGLGALLMLVVGWKTLRWLGPHVAPPLDRAVYGYIVIIGVMVALAAGASASTGDVRFVIGALAFAVSDLSVARERFVHPSFANLAWGLPLYYAAQLVLAQGIPSFAATGAQQWTNGPSDRARNEGMPQGARFDRPRELSTRARPDHGWSDYAAQPGGRPTHGRSE